jgi:hypothetical protein
MVNESLRGLCLECLHYVIGFGFRIVSLTYKQGPKCNLKNVSRLPHDAWDRFPEGEAWDRFP